jgi:hypothetical protein
LSENPLNMVINKINKMIPKGLPSIIHSVDSSTEKESNQPKENLTISAVLDSLLVKSRDGIVYNKRTGRGHLKI